MGLDLRFFGQFVEGSDSWVSFSLMKTQQDLAGKKMPMPSDHRYSVALFFTDYFPKFPKLKFALRGIFSDGLTMVPPRQTRDKVWFRAPAYKRVDIGLSYQIVGNPAADGSRTSPSASTCSTSSTSPTSAPTIGSRTSTTYSTPFPTT